MMSNMDLSCRFCSKCVSPTFPFMSTAALGAYLSAFVYVYVYVCVCVCVCVCAVGLKLQVSSTL